LINGAVVWVKKAFGEILCAVVNNFGFLVREQFAVAAMGWYKASGRGVFLLHVGCFKYFVGRGATFVTEDAASVLVARVAHRPINLQN